MSVDSNNFFNKSFTSAEHFFSYPESKYLLITTEENSASEISINFGDVRNTTRLALSIIFGVLTLGVVHLAFWIARVVRNVKCKTIEERNNKSISAILNMMTILGQEEQTLNRYAVTKTNNSISIALGEGVDAKEREYPWVQRSWSDTCKMETIQTSLEQKINEEIERRIPLILSDLNSMFGHGSTVIQCVEVFFDQDLGGLQYSCETQSGDSIKGHVAKNSLLSSLDEIRETLRFLLLEKHLNAQEKDLFPFVEEQSYLFSGVKMMNNEIYLQVITPDSDRWVEISSNKKIGFNLCEEQRRDHSLQNALLVFLQNARELSIGNKELSEILQSIVENQKDIDESVEDVVYLYNSEERSFLLEENGFKVRLNLEMEMEGIEGPNASVLQSCKKIRDAQIRILSAGREEVNRCIDQANETMKLIILNYGLEGSFSFALKPCRNNKDLSFERTRVFSKSKNTVTCSLFTKRVLTTDFSIILKQIQKMFLEENAMITKGPVFDGYDFIMENSVHNIFGSISGVEIKQDQKSIFVDGQMYAVKDAEGEGFEINPNIPFSSHLDLIARISKVKDTLDRLSGVSRSLPIDFSGNPFVMETSDGYDFSCSIDREKREHVFYIKEEGEDDWIEKMRYRVDAEGSKITDFSFMEGHGITFNDLFNRFERVGEKKQRLHDFVEIVTLNEEGQSLFLLKGNKILRYENDSIFPKASLGKIFNAGSSSGNNITVDSDGRLVIHYNSSRENRVCLDDLIGGLQQELHNQCVMIRQLQTVHGLLKDSDLELNHEDPNEEFAFGIVKLTESKGVQYQVLNKSNLERIGFVVFDEEGNLLKIDGNVSNCVTEQINSLEKEKECRAQLENLNKLVEENPVYKDIEILINHKGHRYTFLAMREKEQCNIWSLGDETIEFSVDGDSMIGLITLSGNLQDTIDLIKATCDTLDFSKKSKEILKNSSLIDALRHIKRELKFRGPTKIEVVDGICGLYYDAESEESKEQWKFISRHWMESKCFCLSFQLEEDQFVLQRESTVINYDSIKEMLKQLEIKVRPHCLNLADTKYLFSKERESQTYQTYRTVEQQAPYRGYPSRSEIDKEVVVSEVENEKVTLKYTRQQVGYRHAYGCFTEIVGCNESYIGSIQEDGTLLLVNEETNEEIFGPSYKMIREIIQANRPSVSVQSGTTVRLKEAKMAIRTYFHQTGQMMNFGALRVYDGDGTDMGGLSKNFITTYFEAGVALLPKTNEELSGNYLLKRFEKLGEEKSDYKDLYGKFFNFGKMVQLAYMQGVGRAKTLTGIIFHDFFWDVVRELNEYALEQENIEIRGLLQAKNLIVQRLAFASTSTKYDHLLPIIEYLSGEITLKQLLEKEAFYNHLEILAENFYGMLEEEDLENKDVLLVKIDQNRKTREKFDQYLEYSLDISCGQILNPILAIVKGMTSCRAMTANKLTLEKIQNRTFPDSLQGKLTKEMVISALYCNDSRIKQKVNWLKEYLLSCPEENIAKFLKFVTGSRTLLSGTTIRCQAGSSKLMLGHTCFNLLDLYRGRETQVEFNKKLNVVLPYSDAPFTFA